MDGTFTKKIFSLTVLLAVSDGNGTFEQCVVLSVYFIRPHVA